MDKGKMTVFIRLLWIMIHVPDCYGAIHNELDFSFASAKDEYVVRLTDSDTAAFRIRANSISSVFETTATTYIGDTPIMVVEEEMDIPDEDVFARLQEEFGDSIDFVTNNFIVSTAGVAVNKSADVSNTCHSHEATGGQWGLARISNRDIPTANTDKVYRWSDSEDGNGVIIYIMDTGVYLENNEFKDIDASHGFTGESLRPEGDLDLNGHGTHVAGIAAGKNYGVAKHSNIVAVKVLGSSGGGNLFETIDGMNYIINDVKRRMKGGRKVKAVVNMSLGGGKCNQISEDAFEKAAEMGVILVAAAGNSAQDASDRWPACSPHVITVGAIDNTDTVARFSNYGSRVQILAPGVDIKSAGLGFRAATAVMSGTSMAAPFVSGAIARYLSGTEDTNDLDCVRGFLVETSTKNKAIIPHHQRPMPNRILYAGCNTAESGFTCIHADEGDGIWNLDNFKNFHTLAIVVGFIVFMCFIIICIARRSKQRKARNRGTVNVARFKPDAMYRKC